MLSCVLEVAQALLTPLIALIAIWVAWQQLRTNRNKFRLDLFEKRYAIYQAAKALFVVFSRDGRLTYEAVREFHLDTSQAKFLFGEDVSGFLNLVSDAAFYNSGLNEERAEAEDRDTRVRLIDAIKASKLRMRELWDKLDSVFMPYLGFPQRHG